MYPQQPNPYQHNHNQPPPQQPPPQSSRAAWWQRPTFAGQRQRDKAAARLMPGEVAQAFVPGRWWGGDGMVMVTNFRVLLQPRMAAMGRREHQISRTQIQAWKVKNGLAQSTVKIKAGRRIALTVARADAQLLADALAVQMPMQQGGPDW